MLSETRIKAPGISWGLSWKQHFNYIFSTLSFIYEGIVCFYYVTQTGTNLGQACQTHSPWAVSGPWSPAIWPLSLIRPTQGRVQACDAGLDWGHRPLSFSPAYLIQQLLWLKFQSSWNGHHVYHSPELLGWVAYTMKSSWDSHYMQQSRWSDCTTRYAHSSHSRICLSSSAGPRPDGAATRSDMLGEQGLWAQSSPRTGLLALLCTTGTRWVWHPWSPHQGTVGNWDQCARIPQCFMCNPAMWLLYGQLPSLSPWCHKPFPRCDLTFLNGCKDMPKLPFSATSAQTLGFSSSVQILNYLPIHDTKKTYTTHNIYTCKTLHQLKTSGDLDLPSTWSKQIMAEMAAHRHNWY